MGLAKRVIPVLLHRNGNLVKGKQFDSSRIVGNAMQAAEIHAARGVDELIVLDVGATSSGQGPDIEYMRRLTDCCFVPVTVGGGVKEVWQVRELLANGADKVVIGTEAIYRPELIQECADKFGSQAVVVAINTRRMMDLTPRWQVCGMGDHRPWGDASLKLIAFVELVQKMGAGEILLNSIDHDGMMNGYDIKLLKKITDGITIPVVICGGAGDYHHMHAALGAGASAVAAGAMFQWTEATPKGASEYLAKRGWEMRL